MKRDLIYAAIGGYILLMAAYWFSGDSSVAWAYYYYFVEKMFAAFGFWLLYRNVKSPFMRNVALYCFFLCIFMLAYFVYTQNFGHSNWLTVGGLLIYSFVFLTLIRLRS